MLGKAPLLVFYCLTVHTMCSPVYPARRFENSSILGRMLSTPAEESDITQARRLYEDHESALDTTGKRTERHADAVFTNSYRKVLGQMSARKLLQTIMGKRVGDSSLEDEPEFFSKRNSDDIFTDTYARYQRQMAIRKYLAEILGNQRLENINIRQLPEDFSAALEAYYGSKSSYNN
ncbi:glucagon family neuropeptides-like [Rhincodon typus]|uniref:glucagon family neuropeptides-like n=1 Tax=Rhincodon typus TaxID=259920 RepID=UPI00202FF7B3|nr:glucagon family neuropeptides-like [Rhincodon typus]